MLDPKAHQLGFLPVSRLFLTNYRKMNISMEEAMLILHLLDHSWAAEKPFPSAEYFGKVTGKSGQTVRAYLRSLSYKGYLTPVRNELNEKTYSWAPLMGALQDLANIPMEAKVNNEQVKSSCPLKELIDTAQELTKDASKKRTPIQTKPKEWRKIHSFQQKTPSEYNAKDLEMVLAIEWKKKWQSPAPRFYGRDLKHAKDLISIYTAKTVTEVIVWSVENWDTITQTYNIKGYPSMPIFWGFRNSLFPQYIDGDLSKNKPNWGSQFTPEDSKPDGDEIGW